MPQSPLQDSWVEENLILTAPEESESITDVEVGVIHCKLIWDEVTQGLQVQILSTSTVIGAEQSVRDAETFKELGLALMVTTHIS